MRYSYYIPSTGTFFGPEADLCKKLYDSLEIGYEPSISHYNGVSIIDDKIRLVIQNFFEPFKQGKGQQRSPVYLVVDNPHILCQQL